MTPSEKITSTRTALSMFFIVVMVISVAFLATGESSIENQDKPLSRTPGDQGSGNGTENEAGQNNETGNDGNQTGQGDENGGNGSIHQHEHGPDDAGEGHYRWNWSDNASREQLEREWQKDKVNNSWRHRYRNEIRNGLDNGKIIIEANIGKKEGNLSHERSQCRNGTEMRIEEAEGNALRVRISAEFKEGKVIVLNIEDDVLELGDIDDLIVMFDDEAIEMGPIDEVINAEGSEPKYIVALDNDGAQFLVYIPHFSEHTIEIKSGPDDTKEDTFTLFYLIIIIIIIGVLFYVYKTAKRR